MNPLQARIIMTFQSTPPVKAATIAAHQHHNQVQISIHAAREGGDYLPYAVPFMIEPFQSTPPVKAATY